MPITVGLVRRCLGVLVNPSPWRLVRFLRPLLFSFFFLRDCAVATQRRRPPVSLKTPRRPASHCWSKDQFGPLRYIFLRAIRNEDKRDDDVLPEEPVRLKQEMVKAQRRSAVAGGLGWSLGYECAVCIANLHATKMETETRFRLSFAWWPAGDGQGG